MNDEVKVEFVEEHPGNSQSRTEEDNLAIVENNPERFRYFDVIYKTPDVCLKAVTLDALLIDSVPEENMTEELLNLAIDSKPKAILLVPFTRLTRRLYLRAVSLKGILLRDLPTEFSLTAAMCLAAVKQNGLAYKLCPNHFRTNDLALAAVSQNGLALDLVNETDMNFEVCMAAVKSNPKAFVYIPEKMENFELCMEAVKNSGILLRNVSSPLRTESICIAAVLNRPRAIRHVPRVLKNFVLAEVEGKGSDNEILTTENGEK